MLRIRFRPENAPAELYGALRRKGPQVIEVLRTKLTALVFLLQSKIVAHKLSGQSLHRRTGLLAGSVRAIPAEYANGGHRIIASVLAAEGPAFYGKVHEFGGNHAYEITSVKTRALKFLQNGKEVYAQSVMHPRAMKRAFMKPTEIESKEWILDELEAALRVEIQSP